MTYNETPRRRFNEKQRAEFLCAHEYTCYWCREAIDPNKPWDIEHVIPRELMPGKDADADGNLKPIHSHPAPCHKAKTALDRKLIAKSNRIRRAADPETRRKTKHPIRSNPKIQSRPFQHRSKTK